MFNNKLKAENDALKIENTQLKAFIEKKQIEEKAELERMKQMSNFWGYDGSPQEGN